jgi:hypothetical protein
MHDNAHAMHAESCNKAVQATFSTLHAVYCAAEERTSGLASAVTGPHLGPVVVVTAHHHAQPPSSRFGPCAGHAEVLIEEFFSRHLQYHSGTVGNITVSQSAPTSQ